MSIKKCARCETAFECCTEGRGCWCENYRVLSDVLKELEKKFDDCLCESCLRSCAKNGLETIEN